MSATAGLHHTELTRGPWDPGAQHAGPPSALLAREIELVQGAERFQVGRISFEILRPVPIAAVRGTDAGGAARAQGPDGRGRAVEGEVLMRARAWRLREGRSSCPTGPSAPPPASGSGARRTKAEFFADRAAATDTTRRWNAAPSPGASSSPGPDRLDADAGAGWSAGEEPTALQRILVAADVGNGISAVLDWRRYVFINVELSVHVERMPEGEWVGVDAMTVAQRERGRNRRVGPFRQRGRIGRAAQALLIAERG